MSWFGFEQRWCDALFGAMIPAVGGRPGIGGLDLRAYWVQYDSAAPALAKIGLRAAIWILNLLPIVFGCFKTFASLGPAERDAFLVAAASSRFYLVRQLIMTLKTFAVFAYFQDTGVRRLYEAGGG